MNRSFRRIVPSILLAMAVVGHGPAYAQAGGSVRGSVTAADTRAPIAGARVAVATPSRVGISDDAGNYVLRDLPPGQYDLVITAVGRKPLHAPITVQAGQETRMDVALEAGSIMLSSVLVSATSTPIEATRVAATVNVLTQAQVRASPARGTQDLLREIPGIELPRTSSTVGGNAQIVSIRGVDEGRTAVLLDGVPLTDAWGEWVDWDRAPKGSIERVEVLEGGGSNLYGNGAMGGVISLFSRPITPGSYRLSAQSGSRELRSAYASAGVALGGPFAASVTGDYGSGGGYRMLSKAFAGPIDTASSSTRRNLIARVEYAPSATLSAFVSQHFFGDNRALGTPLSRAARDDGSTEGGINAGSLREGLLTARVWNREMREDNWSTSVSAVNGVPRSLERVTAWTHTPSYDRGLALSWSRSDVWGFQSVGVGGDYRYLRGFLAEQDYANNAANAPTTHSTYGGNQALSGVFATGLLNPTPKLFVELSARFDSWGNNDGFSNDASGAATYPNATRNAFSPRVGAKYVVNAAFGVHAAAYQAFRAPNLAELYRKSISSTTISIPNPALKPEYATGVEFGADWQPVAWFQMKGTIYHTDYRDFNTFVTTSPPGATPATRQRQNVTKAKGLGGEVYVAVRPVNHLDVSASANFNDTRVDDLGPATATATLFKGARVARVPMQKGTIRASYDAPAFGTLTVMGRYEGTNTTFGNAVTLPDFAVFDASYSRTLRPGLDLFVGAENLFDRQYWVNASGSTATPTNISLGTPFTLRAGLEAYRY
jgi:iron complex outermembrane receptor protein